MLEILKKTYLAGAGLAAKGWDEVEVVSKEIVKKAKMSEKEGAKFVKDMKKRYDHTQKKTGKYVENIVKDILKKMDIATSADIKALKREITQLKKAVGPTTTRKRSRTTAAKKRTGSTTAKKRTRTTTAAKKRTSSTTAKKRTRTTTAKKPAGRASTKRRSASAGTKKPTRRAATKKS